MNIGKIISFNGTYGFINGKDGKTYYFDDRQFKKNQPIRNLKVGMNLHFDYITTDKGYKAKNIIVPENALGLEMATKFQIFERDFNKDEEFYITEFEYFTKKHTSLLLAQKEAEKFAKDNKANFIIYDFMEEKVEKETVFYILYSKCGIYFNKFYYETLKESEQSLKETDQICKEFKKRVNKYTAHINN